MKAKRHGPAVKIVHERLKVPTDREVFGSLARPSCLGANRFMNEIHDINGVLELGNVRWHGALPSAHMGEPRREIRRRRAGAASCGAVSTQVLARRRGRDSPQSSFIVSTGKDRRSHFKRKTNCFYQWQ